MTFIDNDAFSSGASIFTSSVLPCTWPGVNSSKMIFHWKGWKYYRSKPTYNFTIDEIVTSAGYITYNKSIMNRSGEILLKAMVGQKFKLPITVQDDLFQNEGASSTTFKTQIVSSSPSNVTVKHVIMTAEENLELLGQENTTVVVALDALGRRSWHVDLKVHLQPCPPGYYFNDTQCFCQNNNFGSRIHCNTKSLQAAIKNGYWMGIIDNKVVLLYMCPPSYCNIDEHFSPYYTLPQDYSDLMESLCGGTKNREGILCGLCKRNHGVSVTTDRLECVPCKDNRVSSNIMKYIMVACFPSIVLIVLLLLFKVKISNGTANGFLFYAQMVTSVFGLSPDGSAFLNVNTSASWSSYWKLYQIMYGAFQLRILENIVPPLCIHSKLNALDVFQLDYLMVLLPPIITIIAYKIVNLVQTRLRQKKKPSSQSSRANKWSLGENKVNVLALYLLLSYTRLTLPALNTLKSTKHHKFVFYAAQYKTSDVEYKWRYELPAYLVILAAAFLPIVLFHYPIIGMQKCISRVKWMSKIYPKKRIHSFLDIFQRCYKGNRKYFAGVYIFARLWMEAVNMLSTDPFHYYVALMVSYTLLILLVGTLRPYRKEYLNIVDILLLSNLALITLTSLYSTSFDIFYDGNSPSSRTKMMTANYILAYISMISFIAYVLWSGMPKLIKKQFTLGRHNIAAKLRKIKSQFLMTSDRNKYEEIFSEDEFLNANRNEYMSASMEGGDGNPVPHTNDNSSHSEKLGAGSANARSPGIKDGQNNSSVNEMSSLIDSISRPQTYGRL